MKNFKIEKKWLALSFGIGLIVYLLNLYTYLNQIIVYSIYEKDYFLIGIDHETYSYAIELFYSGNNPYQAPKFIYTIYYCIIAIYHLLPIPLSLFIKISVMSFILAYFLSKFNNSRNKNEKFWFLANTINWVMEYVILNTNMIIVFVFSLYFHEHKKKPHYGLLMIFSFFKINTMVVFLGVIIIESIYNSSFLKNELPHIFLAFSIGIISLIISLNMGIMNDNMQILGSVSVFSPQHFIFYSFFIVILFEREIFSDYKIFKMIYRHKKQIWIMLGLLIASIHLYRLIIYF